MTTSRFQFVDLAGSERLNEAHAGGGSHFGNPEAIAGLMTNYSLMMLSTCVRSLRADHVGSLEQDDVEHAVRSPEAFGRMAAGLLGALSDPYTSYAS